MVQDRKRTGLGSKKDDALLVSVIMPAFNAEKTITGAINSILTQTYTNWELIIVDDGSLDNTKQKINAFKDSRIKALHCTSQGVAEARNIGNKHASGEICIVQDADDYSLPNRLEEIVKVFQRTNAEVIVHSALVSSWNQQYQCPERHYLKAVVGKKAALENKIIGWPAYKKYVWERKPFRKETRYSYDWMMHLDWTLSGFKYFALDKPLYEYIRYQGSASDRFEKAGLRQKAFETIKEIVNKEYNETTRYGSDGLVQKA